MNCRGSCLLQRAEKLYQQPCMCIFSGNRKKVAPSILMSFDKVKTLITPEKQVKVYRRLTRHLDLFDNGIQKIYACEKASQQQCYQGSKYWSDRKQETVRYQQQYDKHHKGTLALITLVVFCALKKMVLSIFLDALIQVASWKHIQISFRAVQAQKTELEVSGHMIGPIVDIWCH